MIRLSIVVLPGRTFASRCGVGFVSELSFTRHFPVFEDFRSKPFLFVLNSLPLSFFPCYSRSYLTHALLDPSFQKSIFGSQVEYFQFATSQAKTFLSAFRELISMPNIPLYFDKRSVRGSFSLSGLKSISASFEVLVS